ncbi:MAG: hypothetical protein D6766_02280, partial [Verrucomicrobia bacterium]
MNLTLHLIRTDIRRFRWSLGLFWGALAAGLLLEWLLPPSAPRQTALTLLFLAEVLLALWLVVLVVLGDALTGSTAAWMTRPIGRRSLLAAKTLWMVGFLLAPYVVAAVLRFVAAGFGWSTAVKAGLEALLFGGAFLWCVAALAACVRTTFGFLAAAGAVFGAAALVGAVLGWIRFRSSEPGPVTLETSAVLVAWAWLWVCALGAWIVRVMLPPRTPGVGLFGAGVLGALLLGFFWPVDFLAPRAGSGARLNIEVIDDASAAASSGPGQQLLWGGFRVSGLATNEVLVASGLEATLEAGARGVGRWEHHELWPRTPTESGQKGAAMALIRRWFPTNTLWFGAWEFRDGPSWLHLPKDPEWFAAYAREPAPGRFSGKVRGVRWRLHAAAPIRLQPQSFTLRQGVRLSLRQVTVRPDRLRLDWLVEFPVLVSDAAGRSLADDMVGRLQFVLHHEPSAEAHGVSSSFTLRPWPSAGPPSLGSQRFSIEFPYSELRARLTGVSTEDWLREARLWVFEFTPLETVTLDFQRTNYVLRLYPENAGSASAEADELEVIRQLRLPEQPTEADLEAYLRVLLRHAPDRLTQSNRDLMQEKLEAIGPAGVPVLLRLMPIRERVFHYFVRDVLRRLLREEHKPALLDALARAPELVTVVRARGWEKDAIPVAVEMIRSRRGAVLPEIVRIAAMAKQPETHPDLAWHFIHNRTGHEFMLPALEACPGFDVASVVREAWRRARIGLASPRGLVLPAARLGLPGALQ